MIYTSIISLLIGKLFYLLRPQSFSLQIVSEFIDTFNFYVLGVGLLAPCFVPRGGVLYTMIVPGGRVLAPFESCPEVCPGGMVLDEIDTCITAMGVTVNEVSSQLCKILTLIIVKTYLQTGRRRHRIARRSVVTCYNSVKPPETSQSVRKRPKTHSFPLDAQVEMAFIIKIMPFFSA